MSYKIVSEILLMQENIALSDKTELSKDPEKAKREKQFLIKLAIIGTTVGVVTSAWQLLREPSLRRKVISAAKKKNPKALWSMIGIPLVGGAVVDVAAEPAAGWVAQKWQDASEPKR